jgi:predicted enzyme related to lactoylglutathione lyase
MASDDKTLHLNEIAQVAISVQNLAEAKEFYQHILGMRFLFDAGTMAFFQCGTVRLMIGTSEKPSAPGGTILYFRVPDIKSAHGTLKNQGVEFVQEPHLVARMKSHDLWLAFLKDPAGNTLALMSEIERSAQEQQN